MRSILNLALRLPGGQVTIPVALASAARRGGIEFKRLHRDCQTPIEERAWCPLHGAEVTSDEIVRAFEVADGEYIPVDDQELAELIPQPSSSVEIETFLSADQLPASQVDRCYYLKPRPEQLGRRSYLTLRAALGLTGAVALARLAAWRNEYPCAIRPAAPDSAALLLQTLHWAEDLVPVRELELELAAQELVDEEVDLARQLVDRHTRTLKKAPLDSRYRPALRALIEQKLAAGKKVTPQRVAAAPAFDLADALKRSLKPRRRTTAAAS
jgi:DNA end-binding protein Ku